ASDMVALYVSIFRKMLDDSALMKVLGGDGSAEDALPKVQKLAVAALKKSRKKYNNRLDLWRLQLLTDMLEDAEKTIKGLDAFLGRMDRAVRDEDQANAQLMGVMALMVAGRRGDGLSRLKAAYTRAAKLIGRFEKHDERLSSDTRMKLGECQKGGCIDRSRAYTYLGAIRNMLARHQPDAERDQWHADTIVALRKAERFVADRGLAGSTLHAQLMTHRCWALGQRSDQKATHQCVGDLLNRHSSLAPVRAIYAAMIASDPTRRLEAKQLFGVISTDASLSAGLRYDAFKWLALFAVSEDDQPELRRVVASAIDERKGVTRFGQSLDYAGVVSDGAFNIGLGFGAEGQPIHQVTTTIDLWSIVTAPIDDSKLDQVGGGSAD
ncbi:MAG: hypothetical protein ACI9OJ_002475, partial [Myxococcota bacterium]